MPCCRLHLEALEPRHLPSAISDLAYPFANERVAEPLQNFFVYKDADSAFNHGFPSGFFGAASKLHIDTGGIDDPGSPTGVSADPNRLDRARGNVFRLTFDPQLPGEFTGLNIREPENASASGRGYDLSGATQLVLDVRSPTPGGIRVQFGVDGHLTPFMLIPESTTFTTLTISLSSLGGGVLDLSSVHVLLSVVTNDQNAPNGGTLLIDNVRFTPVPAPQQPFASLPLANETFGVIPLTTRSPGRVPFPSDQVLRNAATTYESALLLLALLERGQPQDVSSARMVAEGLVYALGHDNQGLPLPPAPDNSTGLHNAYSAGDLPLLNNQGPNQAQASNVRLAGFSVGNQFFLLLDGATGGNNAFAMLALIKANRALGDVRYLNAARTIGGWIVQNLADTSGTGFGGFFNGYPDMGQAKVLDRGKSIENNADIFAAFTQLAAVERGLGNAGAGDLWTTRANQAGDFVMALFDPSLGRFFAGTVPVGSAPGPGIDPSGPTRGNDVVNRFDLLDSNSFTTLALAGSPRYRSAIDWRRPVQYVLQNFAQTVTAGGRTFAGFNIAKQPTAGPNGVAWEFTGQAVVLMRHVDRLYVESNFATAALSYLAQISQAQVSAPFANGRGLVASTLQGGDQLPPIEQALSTPFQDIAERVGLAATTWAIFADQGTNILSPPGVVTAVVVTGGAAQRSRVTDVSVTFSTVVMLPTDPRLAFRVSRVGPGAPAGDVLLAVDLSGSSATQTVAKLTFSGALTEFGSLIDGNYTLMVLGSQVTDNGQPLDGDGNGVPGGDYTFTLFRLFGDSDGDRDVDFSDLARLRTALGSAAGYNPAFDFDGDGDVDFSDLARFRQRLGTSLP